MQDFQAKWDAQIERLALKGDVCPYRRAAREFAKGNFMITKMRNFVNQKLPSLTMFLSKCTNKQTPIIKINGKEIALTYQTRRFIVFSYVLMPLLFKKKGMIRNYLIWSLLLCRENFDIRNYKFNQSIPKK